MKQAVALSLCTIVAGALAVPAEAKSRPAVPVGAPPVVAVPKVPVNRQGGLPVDRGVSRGDARGYRARDTQTVGPAMPLVLARPWLERLAPAREQVLDLRLQVKQRYQGRGLGARLAQEIP